MKNILIFFLCALFSLTTLHSFSQDNQDSIKLLERSKAYLNYENYRSSITDTTPSSLKKLHSLQTDLILLDNQIIRNYISTNSSKVEELQKKVKIAELEKTQIRDRLSEKNKLMLYCLAGLAVFVIFTILFIILFVISSKKKGKAISQLIKIDKIKEEQLKEIGFLKNEIENNSLSLKNEFHLSKSALENELKLQKEKVEDIVRDKHLLENKLKENENSLNELSRNQNSKQTADQSEITELKNNHKNQVGHLNEEINNLKNTISSLDEKIQQTDLLYKNKCCDYDSLQKQLAESRELLEKGAQSIQVSGENTTAFSMEKFNKLESEKAFLESELKTGKEELGRIQTELANYKIQLQNEFQLRMEIENEIKQIIEEIKEMRK